jgi:dephospho-CoA kinase
LCDIILHHIFSVQQVQQLADLIDEINKEQTNLDRKKLITLCTIDVHARDVLTRLIEERVEDGMCFQWQSQLRYEPFLTCTSTGSQISCK